MTKIRSIPLIAVRDVLASSAWYADLLQAEPLGRTHAETHGNSYNRLMNGGEVVLQLHAWDREDHPNLTGPHERRPGHGVLLWFQVPDFAASATRAGKLDAEILMEEQVNPGPNAPEIWLRDPDGYVVVLSGPDGSAA